jgi:hypothetical protein
MINAFQLSVILMNVVAPSYLDRLTTLLKTQSAFYVLERGTLEQMVLEYKSQCHSHDLDNFWLVL